MLGLCITFAACKSNEPTAVITNGVCGKNLTWNYDKATATLTITGTGEMDAYYEFNKHNGWNDYSEEIHNIIIEEGVTSIGNRRFTNCTSLTSVKLPNSLESINEGAFFGCSAVKNITIPEKVTDIGYEAFRKCSSLETINIPNSVTNLGIGAFHECSSLTYAIISSGVKYIKSWAFANCSKLKQITVLSTTPPAIGTDSFREVSRDIPVYVPKEAIESYKAKAEWNEFNLQAIEQ